MSKKKLMAAKQLCDNESQQEIIGLPLFLKKEGDQIIVVAYEGCNVTDDWKAWIAGQFRKN